MRIALIVEGQTERVFVGHLRSFLNSHLAGRMPTLASHPFDGHIPQGTRLKRWVELLLGDRQRPADAVVALTDVYTGITPPMFADAVDAKNLLRNWVGPNDRFHPHAAQFDFEAWLLPYWHEVQRLADTNRAAPSSQPEEVNHMNPPAHRIAEAFRIGRRGRSYVKPRDAARILRDQDLSVAIHACAELKSLVNTILTLCGGQPIT